MADEALKLDASRCALIIQDLQNDVIIDGGAFAESGSPEHAKEQNVVENVKALAETAREKGIPVIHVHYIVEEGAPGLKLNAPLFEGVKEASALVRGSWGAAPAEGLEPQDGDHVVEKMRMSAWQETNLESVLEQEGRDTVIVTGAWTNMSIEHTSRTGADKGYYMVVPEDACSTMNADWHNASINYALAERRQRHQLRRGEGGARMSCGWGGMEMARGEGSRGRLLRAGTAARGPRDRVRRAARGRGARPDDGLRHLRHRPARRQGRVAAAHADGAGPRGRGRRGGRG